MRILTILFAFFLGTILSNAQSLTFKVTTIDFVGNEGGYYFAVWITNQNGVFVKSLMTYVGGHPEDMPKWVNETGKSKVGAVTGATQKTHIARTITWNCKNLSNVVIPDGTYKIRVEGTSSQGATSNSFTYDFVKSPNKQTITPANNANLKDMQIVYTPLSTSVLEVSIIPEVVIAVDPFARNFNIVSSNGQNTISSVTIMGLDGRRVLQQNYHTNSATSLTISGANIPAGIYLVSVVSNNKQYLTKVILK